MRKRILYSLLAAIMIVAMLPGLAFPASAASQMTASEDLVDFIKEHEGFRSEAYVSGGQWSIGYGTSASPGDTITREEAEEALRDHLLGVEKSLNSFITRYGLSLDQGQFDALASFTYNCGAAWMNQSGRFRRAVINGASESQFLFAISLWANNGSLPDPVLLKRRLAEADMYLNGTYSRTSSTYTYTIFDANGGVPRRAPAEKTRCRATGKILPPRSWWRIRRPGRLPVCRRMVHRQGRRGAKVTELTASTAGKTLYAHYKSNGSSSWESGSDVSGSDGSTKVVATGRVKCSTYVNVRKGAGHRQRPGWQGDQRHQGQHLPDHHGGLLPEWGRIDSGCSCMAYVELDSSSGGSDSDGTVSGKVTGATTLNVRSGPGTSYSRVDSLAKGTKVTIYERTTKAGTQWGRIGSNRWVCMSYVTLTEGDSSSTTTDGDEAKVTGATTLKRPHRPGHLLQPG